MATIVRLKRRRDEDPLEMLLLAKKKQKQDSEDDRVFKDDSNKEVFKFAGTVSSKVAGVSHHVREAIRKEKLERELRQHQLDILGSVRENARQHKYKKSQQNRFRVTSKHRALELNCLDKTDELEDDVCQNCGLYKRKLDFSNNAIEKSKENVAKRTDNESGHSESSENGAKIPAESLVNRTEKESGKSGVKEKLKDVESYDKNKDTDQQTVYCDCDNKGSELLKKDNKENANPKFASDKNGENSVADSCINGTEAGNGKVDPRLGGRGDATERLFCLVDVESEPSMSEQVMPVTASDRITCNSEPMEREFVTEGREDDYVYDIYYTNSREFDFRMFERDLTLETLSSDLMYDREMVNSDDEFVYEDDEDENAESNWRNDYPDEDPRYFENENSNYNYENELDEYMAFETETGNQLSDWMAWRCNIDGEDLSSEDEVLDHYGDAGTSYERYYKQVEAELREDDDD